MFFKVEADSTFQGVIGANNVQICVGVASQLVRWKGHQTDGRKQTSSGRKTANKYPFVTDKYSFASDKYPPDKYSLDIAQGLSLSLLCVF